MTSDFLFARSYSHDQQLLAARAAIPQAPSPGVVRTVVLEGTITDPAAKPSIEFQGNAGDIVWVGNPGCVDNFMELGIVGPDGKGLTGGSARTIDRRILPATGMYTLRGYRTNNPTGGPSCRVGTDARLTKTGAHQLVINGADGGRDVYRFVFQGASTR